MFDLLEGKLVVECLLICQIGQHLGAGSFGCVFEVTRRGREKARGFPELAESFYSYPTE